MTLLEACISAREGNFVSHKNFDKDQSMHEYRFDLYYEDGAKLTCNGNMEWLQREEWAKNDWYIKYAKDKVNTNKLKDMHDANKHTMLTSNRSYEECII